MKVYTCNNFRGVCPVGSAATVVAESEEEAKLTLVIWLNQNKLKQNKKDVQRIELIEVALNKNTVRLLNDGDY